MIFSFPVKTPRELALTSFRIFYWEPDRPMAAGNLHAQYMREFQQSFQAGGYEGFCHDSKDLNRFFRVASKLNPFEQRIYNKIRPMVQANRHDYAVIVYFEGDSITYNHELSHAFMKIDKMYEKTMFRLVKQIRPVLLTDLFHSLEHVLRYNFPIHDRDSEYNKKDEIQAFFATTPLTPLRKLFSMHNIRRNDVLPFVKAFNRKKELTRALENSIV